jgi:hypothetical protein
MEIEAGGKTPIGVGGKFKIKNPSPRPVYGRGGIQTFGKGGYQNDRPKRPRTRSSTIGKIGKFELNSKHMGGALAGGIISFSIAYGVDALFRDGVYQDVSPGPFHLFPKVTIIPKIENRITRSAVSGLIGFAPVGITAAVLYFKWPQHKDVAVGLAVGGGITLIGMIIRGIIYEAQAKAGWKNWYTPPK